MSKLALEANQLTKGYGEGEQRFLVLNELSLAVQPGERIAILGPSGSGKSTLMHCLAGLDEPDDGSVILAGERLTGVPREVQASLRSQFLGFVYQAHHLLPEFTALENVAMPLRIRGERPKEAQQQAAETLAEVGLEQRLKHRPAELSGGERQRVAVARALVSRPAVVLADEPTGNLDRANAEKVFELLVALSEQRGSAVLVVTHDPGLRAFTHRSVELRAGRLEPLNERPVDE